MGYFKYCLLAAIMFFSVAAIAQKKNKAAEKVFKAQLVETLPMPPACGTYAYALAHKFRVIEAYSQNYKDKFVIIIEPCPERQGKTFFVAGHLYNITAAVTSGASFNYSVINKYELEQIPTFWSRGIIPLAK